MKKRYKYIHFHSNNENHWFVSNNKSGDLLGELEYNKRWRKWEFLPEPFTGFTEDCLADIIDFINQLKEQK